MKYVDEFRDGDTCLHLIRRVKAAATRRWTIMEVCGGQTHSLLRHGIDEELAEVVELIHGPGCPVCVTPISSIDAAVEYSLRQDVIVASFGDMIRVPGSKESLLQARSRGGRVHVVYSPIDAVNLARDKPDEQVAFLAVGFETTAAATALAVQQAAARNLTNFSLSVAHVRVLPAMELLASSPDRRVDAFLAAGHVCTVDGCALYESFVRDYHLPVVVAGFEPVDLLLALARCVEQLERGVAQVENCYPRSVRWNGNERARQVIDEVYIATDACWRGIGFVPGGGMALREEYARFDATRRLGLTSAIEWGETECRAGEVLTGRLKPTACPHFGNRCTPLQPLGAPMVSAEGACAAYYRYSSATTS